MAKIIIEVPDSDARVIKYYLRKLYNAPRSELPRLCKIAIRKEVARQASKQLEDNAQASPKPAAIE